VTHTLIYNEANYQQIIKYLDDLIVDTHGKEEHPLTPLLHIFGTLISDYESLH